MIPALAFREPARIEAPAHGARALTARHAGAVEPDGTVCGLRITGAGKLILTKQAGRIVGLQGDGAAPGGAPAPMSRCGRYPARSVRSSGTPPASQPPSTGSSTPET